MTASVYTLSIEPTSGAAFQAPFHVGTDLVVAMQQAEETYRHRIWFPGVGDVVIRTVALMRDGRMVDCFDGRWQSDLYEADMAEMEAHDVTEVMNTETYLAHVAAEEAAPADRLPSALAFIPVANLRNLLTFFREEGDHVAVRLIDTELFYRQPIVTHDCGYGHWMATRGDYDLDCTVGSGRTEQEAIDHLIEREDDQRAGAQAFDDGGMAEERARHP